MAASWTVAFAFLAVPFCAPSVAAGVERAAIFDFESAERLVLRFDLTFAGDEASRGRSSFDADEDGNVSTKEEAHVEGLLPDLFATLGDDFEVSLGGRTPDRAGLASGGIDGLSGPVDSNEPFTVGLRFVYNFTHVVGDAHEVRVAVAPETDADERAEFRGEYELTVKAPPGFHIEGIVENGGWRMAPDEKTLTGRIDTRAPAGVPAPEPLIFELSRDDVGGESSAATWAASVAALAAGATGVRAVQRRR